MFARLLMILARFRKDERGASLVEYGLLVALIALTVITTLGTIGKNLNTLFTTVATSLTT